MVQGYPHLNTETIILVSEVDMNSNSEMMRKLQIALNSKDMRILCNRSQFFSEVQNRPVTIYKISQSVWDASTGKNKHVELFSSASQIQCVLFMRNLWFLIQGKEIPPTNNMKGAAEFEAKWAEFEASWKMSNNNSLNNDEGIQKE